MVNSKILPLSEPFVTAFSSHSTVLSILSTDDAYLPWFHSNFIQMYCLKDFHDFNRDVPLDFYMGPRKDFNYYLNNNWLTYLSTEKQLIESTCNGDTINFITQCINNDLYVALYLDEFYIEDRWAYNDRKWEHENLIFGYDLERKVFNMIGYRGANRKFEASEISFDVFIQAYNDCDRTNQYYRNQLYLIRKVVRAEDIYEINYKFNLDFVIRSLEEYVQSADSSKNFAMFQNNLSHLGFGLDVYKYLKANLTEFWFDFRSMHVLWEHKNCMLARLEYMHANGYLEEESFQYLHKSYSEMAKTCLMMRTTQIRYRASKDRVKDHHLLDKIFDELDKISQFEKGIVEYMLNVLKQFQANNKELTAKIN